MATDTQAPQQTLDEPGQTTRVRKGPRGLGAMRHIHLNIDPRIDLTQPIYEQVLALQKADKEADEAAAKPSKA